MPVTYLLKSKNTVKREFGDYEGIKDNFPKYVISLDNFDMSQNGSKHWNIRDFLYTTSGVRLQFLYMDIFISSQNCRTIIELLGFSKEYKEIKEEAESKGIDFNSIRPVIVKFLVRLQITGKYDPKRAVKKIKACLTNDDQKSVRERLKSELKKEYPEICDDSKIEEILSKFQFGIGEYAEAGRRLQRCLLVIVDKASGSEATDSDYKKASIDHIEAHGKGLGFNRREKPIEAVIYTLGNLALLEPEYNVSGQSFNGNQKNDGDWHVKRETYLKSKFESTKRTAKNHEKWTEKDIKDEGKNKVKIIIDQLSLN